MHSSTVERTWKRQKWSMPYHSPFVLSLPRGRTALHMAIGAKNARVVCALMRWRHELNRSLDDELDALDHRRDLFVQEVTLASTTTTATARGGEPAGTSVKDVERFTEWLFEERRRLVRMTELRCEENWHKAMAARDDKGRTPVHWAASGKPEAQSCSPYRYFRWSFTLVGPRNEAERRHVVDLSTCTTVRASGVFSGGRRDHLDVHLCFGPSSPLRFRRNLP